VGASRVGAQVVSLISRRLNVRKPGKSTGLSEGHPSTTQSSTRTKPNGGNLQGGQPLSFQRGDAAALGLSRLSRILGVYREIPFDDIQRDRPRFHGRAGKHLTPERATGARRKFLRWLFVSHGAAGKSSSGDLRRRSSGLGILSSPRSWRGIECAGIFSLQWSQPRKASGQRVIQSATHLNGACNASRRGRRM
jgi:hypothetical protein